VPAVTLRFLGVCFTVGVSCGIPVTPPLPLCGKQLPAAKCAKVSEPALVDDDNRDMTGVMAAFFWLVNSQLSREAREEGPRGKPPFEAN